MNNIILYTILLIIVMYVSMSNTELFRNVRRTAKPATTVQPATPAVIVPPATTVLPATPATTVLPAATVQPATTVQTIPSIPTLQLDQPIVSPDIVNNNIAISGIKQSDAPRTIVNDVLIPKKTVIPSKYYAGTVIDNKYVAGTYIYNPPTEEWRRTVSAQEFENKRNKSDRKIIPLDKTNGDHYKRNEPDAHPRVDIPIIITFCSETDYSLYNRTFSFPNESCVFYTFENDTVKTSMVKVRNRLKQLGRPFWLCCRTAGVNADYTYFNMLTLSIPTGKLVKIFSWQGDVQVFIEGYYETTLKFRPYVIWVGLINYESDIPDNTRFYDLADIN